MWLDCASTAETQPAAGDDVDSAAHESAFALLLLYRVLLQCSAAPFTKLLLLLIFVLLRLVIGLVPCAS
jgi:hypothetical protein